MEFATKKDIERASTLGDHSGATNLPRIKIARGKASSMAKAIKDKNKILGRLEAVAEQWGFDYDVLLPFMKKCVDLYPDSIYSEAYKSGHETSLYLRWKITVPFDISRKQIFEKAELKEREGVTILGAPYKYDSVALIIYNTRLK
jgi:hypothetical protein